MIDANISFYKSSTVPVQIVEDFFSKSRDQAINKNFVSKAEEVALIADDLFYYINTYLPNSPESVSPILLSIPDENAFFNEKTTFTGPNGIIVMVLGEKPFKDPPYLWRSNLLKRVLPSHIIGGDGSVIYIDGEIANIDIFLDIGICVFRAQTITSPDIDIEQLAKDLSQEIINVLEYIE